MPEGQPAGAGDVVDALAEEQADFGRLLAGLDDAGWTLPSPCEGWTVADVVLHVAQSDDLAIASLTGRFAGFAGATPERGAAGEGASGGAGDRTAPMTVDEAAERAVAGERGLPGTAVRDRWKASASELVRLLREGDLARRVQWVAGQMSARTLATTRLAETWIHGGDVAAATGIDRPPTDRLWHIARLAWRTLPYAFTRAGQQMNGPVGFRLAAPGGDEWTFMPEATPATVISGSAIDLCLVAARRTTPERTALRGEGPDASAVLELVRTYA